MLCDKKNQVRASFSRAAKTYNSAATLQDQVGKELCKPLCQFPEPSTILDVGCGTGMHNAALDNQFPQAKLFSVDIALSMLQANPSRHCICSDMDALPIIDNSIDAIFSNLALQWSTHLTHTYRELHRVIKPGGWFAFSTLGEKTLSELRTAWKRVDDYSHTHVFLSVADIVNKLKSANFTVDYKVDVIQQAHHNTIDLMRSLKNIGANRVLDNRRTKILSRNDLQLLESIYPKKDKNSIHATYEVIYCYAKKK